VLGTEMRQKLGTGTQFVVAGCKFSVNWRYPDI
jgi:hypothetical protein